MSQETTEKNEIINVNENGEVINDRVYKLSRPFNWQGKTYTELNLDFESLTGKDLIKAESEFNKKGGFAIMLDLNKEYCAIIAAKAAGVGSDMLMELPANDFSKITTRVTGFLLKSE